MSGEPRPPGFEDGWWQDHHAGLGLEALRREQEELDKALGLKSSKAPNGCLVSLFRLLFRSGLLLPLALH
jgi:hypothetical protein